MEFKERPRMLAFLRRSTWTESYESTAPRGLASSWTSEDRQEGARRMDLGNPLRRTANLQQHSPKSFPNSVDSDSFSVS